MRDLGAVVAPLALVYGAAGAGLAVGLLLRTWTRRGGSTPSPLQATGSACLPAGAAVALPLLTVLLPHAEGPVHAFWHAAEAAVHSSPPAHAALHLTNLLLLLLGLVGLVRVVFTLARMRAFGEALREAGAAVTADGDLRLVRSERPLCFALGGLRPAIYLTTGLREQLDERDLAAVLAHERAHLRRRDGLMGAGLTLFYSLFLLPGSGCLLRDWRAAAERACDAEAARQVGACDVAAALVRVARVVSFQGALPAGSRFTEDPGDIEGRVQALLAGSPGHRTPTALLAFTLVLVLCHTVWLVHLVELFAHH
jgi:hypothetical protein